MKKTKPTHAELIAPCGMNCAICSRYLAGINNLRRSHCSGCRPGNKRCLYLFEKCEGINTSIKGTATARFCFDCDRYPCPHIKRMDKRYRINYGMSVKDNLEDIKSGGVQRFAAKQYRKYHCSKCDGLVSIHNRKCFKCDRMTRLVGKCANMYESVSPNEVL